MLVQCTPNDNSQETENAFGARGIPTATANTDSTTEPGTHFPPTQVPAERPGMPTISPTQTAISTVQVTVPVTADPLPTVPAIPLTIIPSTLTPVPQVSPTPTSPSSTSATATTTIDPTAVPTPVPSATPSPTPTQIVVQPTQQPTPTADLPTPTFTPVPQPEPRFAVVVETKAQSVISHQLSSLGISRFMNYDSDPTGAPSGSEKVILISNPTSESETSVASKASASPGAVWYITAEPNVWGIEPEGYVQNFHQLQTWIKTADPTAKVTSPSILNWEFTCLGCGGYQSGRSWFEEFRLQYLLQIGMEPQVDIWAMDVFPLDWTNLPTVDSAITIDQVRGFRSFLNSNSLNQPIWIMELGLHWGYPGMEFNTPGCGSTPVPTGSYATNEIKNYLDSVFRWLTTQPESEVGAWFVYSTYRDIETCSSDNYAGISLFDENTSSGELTDIGRHIQKWAAGQIQ